ncbi:sodium:proton antiporter [Amycolatopsis sp. FDAARGOS 1241]|uniref:sodium:proton antiporter n=1 Tax=Amycolatopsis sp. FDAARGOS 1241 TaxID=2778070 RepID=UPI001951A35B|nr:cation:proton antiporter subunit C [Amycolatopsis sp. FDAARGOS 1241]QRP49554.1 cation:proton antiporter subunit C [Amycolatopsis sp. FDAARGOS 1241]
MTAACYGVAAWLLLLGCLGIVRSRHLVHTVVSLSVAQSGTYVLLLAIGYQRGAGAPIVTPGQATPIVDPTVQALTLTDIVVSATITALLLALTVQISRRHGTVDPDELKALRG